MVAWDKAKGKQPGGGQKRDIVRLPMKMGDNKIRLVGDLLPRYVYWVITKEGRKIPVECLKFDRETETFNNNAEDPFDEIDEAVFSDKPQFAYVCNAIDRSDGQVKLYDLRSTVYGQIVDYAKDPEYGPPTDEVNGYNFNVKKESTGPLPQNVKYTVVAGRGNAPLTEEEKAMELYELDNIMKRPTYDEQKAWLLKNTTYFMAEVTDEFKATEEVTDLA